MNDFQNKPQERHKSKTVHIAIQIFAILLLIAGIAMLALPGPGWATIIIAIILLGEESKLGRWIMSKLPPRIREAIRKRQQKK